MSLHGQLSPHALIPLPVDCHPNGNVLNISLPVPIYGVVTPAVAPVLETFINETVLSDGIAMKLTGRAKETSDPAGISIEINEGSHKDEAYDLSITVDNVILKTSSSSGLLYGLHTLQQLCKTGSGSLTITGAEIKDSPRFPWRGMHLDVSRHFFPVSFIKKYIDLLARHKMNIFHWHLCDDQGWRIEIPAFPRLTEIGAWRDERDGRYGGFYSQDDISEIVDFASKRCVTVIPEIEMPGHATAALAAYPEYSCTGGPFRVATTWGVFDDVYCVGNNRTFVFLETILSQVTSIFPASFIHIGGDECPKKRWHGHSLCQELKSSEGLQSEDQLQAYFIARIAKFLTSINKRLIGWDEILDGGAPDGSIIMAWRSVEKGIEAAQAGHDVVMCPMPFCYFDHYQADPDKEPKAIGGFTPLDRVYEFDPIPDDLQDNLLSNILGAQGNVWTEYMPDTDHVEYMTFPRLCALSEVLWTQRESRSRDDFLSRLSTHLGRLDRIGVNYRRIDSRT